MLESFFIHFNKDIFILISKYIFILSHEIFLVMITVFWKKLLITLSSK
jgi:hypothetical protein